MVTGYKKIKLNKEDENLNRIEKLLDLSFNKTLYHASFLSENTEEFMIVLYLYQQLYNFYEFGVSPLIPD